MRKPEYYEVWLDRKKMTLVAFDERHNELWRRSDPHTVRHVSNLKMAKKQIFTHQK